MFAFFKPNPVDKLMKQYNQKMQEAMKAQRSGDIRLYSELNAEAELLLKQVDELEKA